MLPLRQYPLFASLCIMLFSAAFGSASADSCVLRSVWEPFEPYQFENAYKDISGLDIDLLKAVATEAGCTLKLRQLPWKRALQLIKEGHIDVASGASQTAEREQFARFSVPYRRETMLLYTLAKRSQTMNIKSLQALSESVYSIGVTLGYTYGNEFDEMRKQGAFVGRLSEMTSDKQNLRRLSLGRVDLVLVEQFVGHQIVQNESLGDTLKPLPLLIPTGSIHFIFSKKSVSQERVQAFDEALKRIINNGTYNAILKHYLRP